MKKTADAERMLNTLLENLHAINRDEPPPHYLKQCVMAAINNIAIRQGVERHKPYRIQRKIGRSFAISVINDVTPSPNA
ncbi:MAG: hypothetical protein RL122_1976 [Pseudomonadota bacterium]|jgi:hypothetical protein